MSSSFPSTVYSAAAEGVSRVVQGGTPSAAPLWPKDLELTFQTPIGTGCNPNVSEVVVIGIKPNWTESIAERIAETGKSGGEFQHRTLRRSENHRGSLGNGYPLCRCRFGLHFFTTGQGNIVGKPIVRVLKISANPLTVRTRPEHVDVDITELLMGWIGLDPAADRVMESFARAAWGGYTAAEVLGHREFVLSKFYRSA